MSTIHNPVNFQPEDYEIIDYFDNRPPDPAEFFMMGMFSGADSQAAAEAYHAAKEQWKLEFKIVYGDNWEKKIFKCIHCGQGNVRYIVACLHIPTNEVVTFGDICVNRLSFKNADEFKMKFIRSKANLKNKKIKHASDYKRYLENNPELSDAFKCYYEHKDNVHGKNSFAADIIYKAYQWMNLSEKQISAFIKSIKQDHEWAENKKKEKEEVKGEVPEGRLEVRGKVLSVKLKETQYGDTYKMLVKLENNSKVYCTVPNYGDSRVVNGVNIVFTATFKRSKDDKSFGFGSRPKLIDVTE